MNTNTVAAITSMVVIVLITLMFSGSPTLTGNVAYDGAATQLFVERPAQPLVRSTIMVNGEKTELSDAQIVGDNVLVRNRETSHLIIELTDSSNAAVTLSIGRVTTPEDTPGTTVPLALTQGDAHWYSILSAFALERLRAEYGSGWYVVLATITTDAGVTNARTTIFLHGA